tara:strand:+ start:2642 stop:3247 length:606 start_codon:yes stop_codon:yes gene_type:complete
MSGLTEDQIKEIAESAVDSKVREYFRMSRPGFVMQSNVDTEAHGLAEFQLTTDLQQGVHWYRQGNCKVSSNNSFELYSGHDAKKKDIGIMIESRNGDVYIKAENGNLVLEGNDVIINTNDSEGQISLTAKKTIFQKSPTIKIEGETTTILGTLDLQCIGGHTSIYSHMSDVEISDGTELEIGPGTVVGFIDKVKKMAALFS